jgi:hypothetical protein
MVFKLLWPYNFVSLLFKYSCCYQFIIAIYVAVTLCYFPIAIEKRKKKINRVKKQRDQQRKEAKRSIEKRSKEINREKKQRTQ